MRLQEAGKETGRVDAKVDIGHCKQERIRTCPGTNLSGVLTQLVAIILDIPLGVLIAQIEIARDLLLLESPLGQLLAAGGEGAVLQVMDEQQPRGDRVHGIVGSPAHNHHTPHIVGIACAQLERHKLGKI